jgi:hypothetical protein
MEKMMGIIPPANAAMADTAKFGISKCGCISNPPGTIELLAKRSLFKFTKNKGHLGCKSSVDVKYLQTINKSTLDFPTFERNLPNRVQKNSQWGIQTVIPK